MKAKALAIGMAILMMTMGAESNCEDPPKETPPAPQKTPAKPAPIGPQKGNAPVPAKPGCEGPDCDFGEVWYEFIVIASHAPGQRAVTVKIIDDSSGKFVNPIFPATPFEKTKKVKYAPERDIMMIVEPKENVPGMIMCKILKHYDGDALRPEVIDYEMNGSQLQEVKCLKESGK